MELQEELLGVMDGKTHPSIGFFTREKPINGLVATVDQFKQHALQEYGILHEFPNYLDKIVEQHGERLPLQVKKDLVANSHEEKHGSLEGVVSHNEMWLYSMAKLGFDRREFENVELIPHARAYRSILWDIVKHSSWQAATAVITIFFEGSSFDRKALDPTLMPKPLAEILATHHLLKFGLKPEELLLKRRHYEVEGGHRHSAYGILPHVDSEPIKKEVVEAMKVSLTMWLNYRDGIASTCRVPGYSSKPIGLKA
jgi:hypothetical protein